MKISDGTDSEGLSMKNNAGAHVLQNILFSILDYKRQCL